MNQFLKEHGSKIIAVLVVGIVLILLVVLSGGKDRSESEGSLNEGEGEEVVNTSSTPMQPVTVGGNEYEFSGITWIFTEVQEEGADPLTEIRIQFEDFIRNGVAINVLPYRLGTYPYPCEVRAPFVEEAFNRAVDGTPLAFSQCWLDGAGRQFIVFQQGQRIVTKTRLISDHDVAYPPLVQISSIDLDTVVR